MEETISTFSFPYVVDGNGDGHIFSCAHVPLTKGTTINNLQEGVIIGTNGRNLTAFCFREDKTSDDSSPIRATAITNRVDPTLAEAGISDTKRFTSLTFPSVDPIEKGIELFYATDVLEPHKDSVAWQPFVYTTGEGRVFFVDARGRWAHLRIEDSTTIVGEEVFSSYSLTYYNLFIRRKYGTT